MYADYSHSINLSTHLMGRALLFLYKCVCLYKKYCTFALVIGKSFCPFHLPERYQDFVMTDWRVLAGCEAEHNRFEEQYYSAFLGFMQETKTA